MKKYLTGTVVLAILMLSACSSSPTFESPPREPVQVVAVDVITENPGLGRIVYNGRPLAECKRQTRTGTRIRRDVCRPNSRNGLFPGGYDLGTGGESQVGYGRN